MVKKIQQISEEELREQEEERIQMMAMVTGCTIDEARKKFGRQTVEPEKKKGRCHDNDCESKKIILRTMTERPMTSTEIWHRIQGQYSGKYKTFTSLLSRYQKYGYITKLNGKRPFLLGLTDFGIANADNPKMLRNKQVKSYKQLQERFVIDLFYDNPDYFRQIVNMISGMNIGGTGGTGGIGGYNGGHCGSDGTSNNDFGGLGDIPPKTSGETEPEIDVDEDEDIDTDETETENDTDNSLIGDMSYEEFENFVYKTDGDSNLVTEDMLSNKFGCDTTKKKMEELYNMTKGLTKDELIMLLMKVKEDYEHKPKPIKVRKDSGSGQQSSDKPKSNERSFDNILWSNKDKKMNYKDYNKLPSKIIVVTALPVGDVRDDVKRLFSRKKVGNYIVVPERAVSTITGLGLARKLTKNEIESLTMKFIGGFVYLCSSVDKNGVIRGNKYQITKVPKGKQQRAKRDIIKFI